MGDCVLAGVVPDQAGRTGRAQGIAGSTFKPDPGELRRVWAATASARAFHIKPLVQFSPEPADSGGMVIPVRIFTLVITATGLACAAMTLLLLAART